MCITHVDIVHIPVSVQLFIHMFSEINSSSCFCYPLLDLCLLGTNSLSFLQSFQAVRSFTSSSTACACRSAPRGSLRTRRAGSVHGATPTVIYATARTATTVTRAWTPRPRFITGRVWRPAPPTLTERLWQLNVKVHTYVFGLWEETKQTQIQEEIPRNFLAESRQLFTSCCVFLLARRRIQLDWNQRKSP